MYRDQEREGHFISPELEYPMICPGIRKWKVILYLLPDPCTYHWVFKFRRYKMTFPFLIPVHIIGYSSSGDIK
jgi:hypothetical protein